jgi:hypothetical protein
VAASTPNPPPEPPNEGSVDAGSTRPKLRSWVKDLSRGVRWLLGVIIVALVGAVVTAIVAGWFGPDELGAELSDVAIDRNVTLDEYAIRHENVSASSLGSASVIHLEVHLVAQTSPEDLPQDEQPQDEQPQDEQPQDEQPQDEQPQDEQPQDEQPQDEQPQDEQQPGGEKTPDDTGMIRGLQLSAQDRKQLNAGVDQALRNDPEADVGQTCGEDAVDPKCGLGPVLPIRFEEEEGAVSDEGEEGAVSDDEEGLVSPEAVARRLTEIFHGTRTRPVLPDRGKRQMVGVTVNFKISMTGFDDGTADIRWSLYSAKSGVPVPRDWLRFRRALSLRGEAEKDSASSEFWVPVPKATGPFFIRIGVYDEHDTRLDYADTPHFR